MFTAKVERLSAFARPAALDMIKGDDGVFRSEKKMEKKRKPITPEQRIIAVQGAEIKRLRRRLERYETAWRKQGWKKL